MTHKNYIVRYRDQNSIYQELTAFAKDSYEARLVAIDKIKYLTDHPHSICNISISE